LRRELLKILFERDLEGAMHLIKEIKADEEDEIHSEGAIDKH
jgi:hypothetical protein